MKNCVLFIFMGLSTLAFGQNQPPETITQHAIKKIPTNSTEYQDIYYLEHLPDDYETSDTEYPVIIFLHGASEQGDPSGAEINKVATWGPPYYIEQGADMKFTVDDSTFSYIVISPQLQYATKDNWSASYIHDVVTHVIDTYRIDIDRIYLTGLSMGGGTIWNYEGQHPNILAAVGIVSSGWPYDPAIVRTVVEDRLAAWVFHGEIDPQISVELPQQWQDSLVALGADPAPLLKIFPNIGHNVWDKAYTIDHRYQDPVNLYEWFLMQTRNDTQRTNEAPVANAGADTTVQLPVESIMLDGSASSDAEGDLATYTWSQVNGPTEATLTGQDGSVLTVSDLAEGIYTFELRVVDSDGEEATDQVRVTVTGSTPLPNQPPVAVAGADTIVQLPFENILLNGSASSDAEGDLTAYAWSQVSGPTEATLDGEDGSVLMVSDLVEGIYVFELRVADGEGEEATDQVQVTVTAASPLPNEPPVAEVSADTTVQLPVEELVLDGSASSDPDDNIAIYSWTQISGPQGATLSGEDTDMLTVSGLTEGTYVFELAVTDEQNAQSTAQVQVTVLPSVVTALEEDSLVDQVLVAYPNPADDRLTVLISGKTPQASVLTLTDLTGKVVRQWKSLPGQQSHPVSIDTKTMPTGVYLLQLQADQLYTTKVFIKH